MPTEAGRYLRQIKTRFDAITNDLPRLIQIAQTMAPGLLAGGYMTTPTLLPAWPSEFGGRAGGMMGIHDFPRNGHRDVSYVALPDRADGRLRRIKHWRVCWPAMRRYSLMVGVKK